ncbi:MAG: DUF1788 domain-containing protein [Treponema sp.]|nr:MAG: DUF1788 domain-containing protein [Treponema sp.]
MSLESRLAELKKDLLSPAGPAISTNRSYPFAIFQYFPTEEYEARSKLGSLAEELRVKGWKVRTVDLFEQLEAYLAEQEGGELVEAIIEEEKLQYRAYGKDWKPALDYLSNTLTPHCNRMDGYPARVLEQIQEEARGGDANRTVVFLSRVGSLYPFYRTSALLRFLDTGVKVPTIILYPGTKEDQHYLSFMGIMSADRDYRPRIY